MRQRKGQAFLRQPQQEVELGLLEPNLRKDNKALLALKNKLNNLQEQYNKMEMGSQDYLVAFKEVPELGKVLTNLLREVKIQNEVYTMLQQQFYKEKIQENKDLPTVEILDEAIPPLSSSSPACLQRAGGFYLLIYCTLSALEERVRLFRQSRLRQDIDLKIQKYRSRGFTYLAEVMSKQVDLYAKRNERLAIFIGLAD